MRLLLHLAGFLVIVFISCRKDPKSAPTNPCIDKAAFKVDFTVEEKVGDTSFITDKALAPGYVFLRAKGDYDSVRWYVGGTQNTSTKRNYTLYFPNAEGPVVVSLIGYKKPDTQCFPNDKTSDTVTKIITIFSRDQTAGIVGKFHGYNQSNPTDTFTVAISYYDNIWGYFIKNLPKGCPGYTTGSESNPKKIGLSLKAGYSAFGIDAGSTACSIVKGIGQLSGQDSLTIAYSYFPQLSSNPYTYANDAKTEKFIGIRKP